MCFHTRGLTHTYYPTTKCIKCSLKIEGWKTTVCSVLVYKPAASTGDAYPQSIAHKSMTQASNFKVHYHDGTWPNSLLTVWNSMHSVWAVVVCTKKYMSVLKTTECVRQRTGCVINVGVHTHTNIPRRDTTGWDFSVSLL